MAGRHCRSPFDAILDRIIQNAHRIVLKDDSLRRQAGEREIMIASRPIARRPTGPSRARRSIARRGTPMNRRNDLQTNRQRSPGENSQQT